ncbi:hypothetical protein LR48_Vigan07g043000 [Vigna angularis]|uniref:pectinesterase n=1 Tax=Phaseolus angularis TaxID=3914 RepID=A0A0L9UVG7_PHAAN|nr:hypothetical protein LR48_Vigan07g043000 [Vigna angularis]
MDCSGNKIAHTIVVDQQGKGDFTIVQAAIDSIQESNYQWVKIHNSYNLVGSETIEPAPATAIYGDKSVFIKCGFESYQNTLFDAQGRHYFKNCYIEGEVDFIYGNGQSYYENCIINATLGKSPPGFVTAQSRGSEKEDSGFVFRGGCVIGNGEVKL